MASAESVKELRARTGAGIVECKKALIESGGDIDGAIEFLRKQGVVKAAKKASRTIKEGWVAIASSANSEGLAVVEVNCETDFVARTDEFQEFVQQLAEHILARKTSSPDVLSNEPFLSEPDKTTEEVLKGVIAKLGENMGVARFDLISCDDPKQRLGSYIHAGNQIGVVLKLEGKVGDDVIKDIAMHVAAMSPLFTDPDQVPEEAAAREKEILKGAEDLQGKPPEMIEKIIVGRYRKFLSQNCLTEQVYIKDPEGKKTVGQYLKSVDSEAKILSFIRYQIGEMARSE